MKKIVFTVTVVLLVIAFGVSAFFVGNYLIEGKQQEDRYDQLAQAVSEAQAATRPTAAPTKDSSTEATTSATEPTMIPGYEELYKENPDTVGWAVSSPGPPRTSMSPVTTSPSSATTWPTAPCSPL